MSKGPECTTLVARAVPDAAGFGAGSGVRIPVACTIRQALAVGAVSSGVGIYLLLAAFPLNYPLFDGETIGWRGSG